jgi:hypothetical protein
VIKFIVMAATLTLSATALAGGNPAGATDTPARAHGNDCTFFRSISDFRPLDRTKLVVWAPSKRDAYLVELGMPLFDLKHANELAFIDSNRDGRLCGYGMDRIAVGNASFPQQSTILGMTRLDATQLVGLEQQYGVRLVSKKKATH